MRPDDAFRLIEESAAAIALGILFALAWLVLHLERIAQ